MHLCVSERERESVCEFACLFVCVKNTAASDCVKLLDWIRWYVSRCTSVSACVCVCLHVCMCVCVCVREREREGQSVCVRERVSVSVCTCV